MENQPPKKNSWVETIRPRPVWLRWLLRGIIHLIGHTAMTVTVHGREHIPASGPLIVVANHFSIWEPPLMIYTIPKPLSILAAGDMDWPWTQAWALYLYGYIPTNRDSFKPSTIRQARRALENGAFLGIFPEAGMSPNYQLRPGKPGAVYLSHLTGAKILPLGFSGYEDPARDWRQLRRPRFHARVGKPFGPFSLSEDSTAKKREFEAYTHAVMRRIAALLPPQHRGYYLDDPAVAPYLMYPFD